MARPRRAHRWRHRLPWGGAASLSAKLVWILTGIGMAGTLGIALMLTLVLTPGFRQLEEQAINREVDRAATALDTLRLQAEAAAIAKRQLWQEGTRLAPGTDRTADALADIDPEAVLRGADAGSFFRWREGILSAVGIARVTSRAVGAANYVAVSQPLGEAQIRQRLQRETRLLPMNADMPSVRRSGSELDLRVPLLGWDGRPAAAIAFPIDRSLWALGGKLLIYAAAGVTALVLLLLIILRGIFHRLVLRRLHLLERHMREVGDSGAMTTLPDPVTEDEIGALVQSFNAMLGQLASLREQVEVQSFRLGQIESAEAAMHNVRNALNPISTILSKGLGQVLPVEPAIVDRALEELGAVDTDPERRDRLAAFLRAALAAERSARAERLSQLEMGRDALQNVLEIIGSRSQRTQDRAPLEVCDVTQLIARNGAIARYSRELSIATVFPSRVCLVRANRVILSQVIGNLFSNAAESIAASQNSGGTIRVSIAEREGQVEVAIRDNGEGFDPADAPRLFQRGFSTRKSRSGGLGLHWCATSMMAMGGALRLESEGPGRGARAVLTLQAGTAEASSEIAA
ncbi:ATP-binding protein [Sphingomonas sp. 3-13AW]|jgi:signal transduction histidine kinase|uniref:ATP-binding protein n=1 Tax=Sphingomonas sp. 3-13AW TaxID=3050450 RepID=UPI003BB706AF